MALHDGRDALDDVHDALDDRHRRYTMSVSESYTMSGNESCAIGCVLHDERERDRWVMSISERSLNDELHDGAHQDKSVTRAQDVWEIVENGFQEAEAGVDQEQRDALKETRKKHKKALYILYQSMDEDTFEAIANTETSKAAWNKLQSTHRGANRVKKMEVIAEYHTKVMVVVNQLRWNVEEITDVRVMEKVLQSLNTKFEIIATMIEETQDLENMTIELFIGSLQAYEEKKKRRMEQTKTVEQLLELKIKEENCRGRGRGRGCRGHGGRGEANTDISQNSSESSRERGGRGRGRRGGRSGRDKSQVQSTASTSKAHQGQSNYAEENGTLFMVSKGEEESQDSMWYLDTGASNHMCGKREMFMELNEMEKGNIAFRDNYLAAIKGIGQLLEKGFEVQMKINCLYLRDNHERLIAKVSMTKN
ncbi:uncharacterized protein LOC120077242 [Benincasa hispida]|uniref:uncharacterized protein LOC120077242 n=1 Tax=Benincasa hispida TaxID=102211 RepID=UPI00190287D9|nr:uncharacterized protein LOC120077242 [Benincasa hispida]